MSSSSPKKKAAKTGSSRPSYLRDDRLRLGGARDPEITDDDNSSPPRPSPPIRPPLLRMFSVDQAKPSAYWAMKVRRLSRSMTTKTGSSHSRQSWGSVSSPSWIVMSPRPIPILTPSDSSVTSSSSSSTSEVSLFRRPSRLRMPRTIAALVILPTD